MLNGWVLLKSLFTLVYSNHLSYISFRGDLEMSNNAPSIINLNRMREHLKKLKGHTFKFAHD